MAENELMKICTVGGNPVSAFLSWRLQATNACDVTLVWKSGYDHVSQYGISFKSNVFGNERFKPRRVVRNPEDAAASQAGPFDYVILCVKALPDVYDLASIIDSIVTPQHTCILVNTTNVIGVESAVEDRFPGNVVLSLVSGAEVTQLGQSEFEHNGSTDIWVGPTMSNLAIPQSIQTDMAQALSMTLSTGQVNCTVSSNIRQQQFERVIGPIAFHPASVIFETASHAKLLGLMGVKEMVSDVMDELMRLAEAYDCKFESDFKQRIMDDMTRPNLPESIMWQDFVARRPMEVETYLGSPIKLARQAEIALPRVETLYAILYNLNLNNRHRPKPNEASPSSNGLSPSSPNGTSPPSRNQSQTGHRPMMQGMPPANGIPPRQGPRSRNMSNMSQPGMRRPPPNGFSRPLPPHMNGGGSRTTSRRGSMDGNELEEFSHLVLYDDIPEGQAEKTTTHSSELALRERELQIRQRELALKEQEMRMRRGRPPPQGPPRRGPGPLRNGPRPSSLDDDDDDDDCIEPNMGPPVPQIDPDTFDMMSVTSRKNRKVPGPAPADIRRNPELEAPHRGGRFRAFSRNRASHTSQLSHAPSVNDNILDDALMGFTSDRYGAVDRGKMSAGSRANSLTASRFDDGQYGPVPGVPAAVTNGSYPRRVTQSPNHHYPPPVRNGGRKPSPPNSFAMNGRPTPSDGFRQAMPHYFPGQSAAVVPQ
ncbi:Meiotically up-regulated protein [Escovopsis weberi]|uniref:Meiotically up-regulated protein n=1 Tax=Escovopsis weberi TaxID=150374 RepID=A0A0M8N0Y1_ESCWE|nr:Meiotically up-regulated protein [Escovopsis weberi]